MKIERKEIEINSQPRRDFVELGKVSFRKMFTMWEQRTMQNSFKISMWFSFFDDRGWKDIKYMRFIVPNIIKN